MTTEQRFIFLSETIWLQVAIFTGILLFARLVMVRAFIEPHHKQKYAQDFPRMWFFGARYDLRIATLTLSPWYLIGLISLINSSLWHGFQTLTPIYIGITSFLILLGSVCNYFYYQTYHNHFDIFLFSFFDDDTKAVVSNIWDDYPIVKCTIGIFVLTLLNALLSHVQLHQRIEFLPNNYESALLSVVAIVLFVFFARGSISTFPLRRENAQVSEFVPLNKMTPNAFMALDWANKDRKKDIQFETVTEEDGVTRLNDLFQQETAAQTTPINAYLNDHKPHVVFSIMEGMGWNVLAFDDKDNNDLLGALRQGFKEDFLFTRFVSSQNGTAPSLCSLLFNSPISTISHSSAQNTELVGSVYRPYKKAGYKTVFISPGNMMWRNLVNYLPKQGVDMIFDQNTLLNEYPEAQKHMTDWGLPDGYAFQYAEKLLKESNEPLFITILTVTNHPPYVTPSFYQPKTVTVTPEFEAKAGSGQIETKEILTTYQYATNALGKFAQNIKNSELGDKTLIAATGDHTLRRIAASMPHDIVIDKAVPFYLYVPSVIQENVPHRFDPNRIGSHKDILPTLYHFSLSDQRYYNIGGRNLLEEAETEPKAFGINCDVMLTQDGVITREAPMQFYPWQDDHSLLIQEQSQTVDPQTQEKLAKLQQLERWWINFDVGQPRNH